jgi:nitroimidazol reductase NimA-like FMN-containing flavoprotein (pyridoxamine 5'-phosphate oxidase superfamily)
MVDPRPGLRILSDGECVKLLRAHDLGRIALVDREVRPLIFPVNYFFDEGVIVFRTAPGTKLDLAPGAYVSFEIDGWDPDNGIGWSVLVKGIAHDLTNPRGAHWANALLAGPTNGAWFAPAVGWHLGQ